MVSSVFIISLALLIKLQSSLSAINLNLIFCSGVIKSIFDGGGNLQKYILVTPATGVNVILQFAFFHR